MNEELAHGPSYDLEIIQMDIQQEEEAEAMDGISNKTKRKVVTTGYCFKFTLTFFDLFVLIIYNNYYSKTISTILLFIRYNIVEQYTPDAFKYLLDEIHKLETELGLLPQKWKVLWDKLEIPPVTMDSLNV